MFAFLGAMGLFIWILCIAAKDTAHVNNYNRRCQLEDAKHNYNDELQNKLRYEDPWKLAKMLGINDYNDMWKFNEEHFNKGVYYIYGDQGRLTLVKLCVEKAGFEYRPEHDTWQARERDIKMGQKPLHKGCIWYGL